MSYAPEFAVNKDAATPPSHHSDNAIEAAAQYSRPLADDWSLGASVALARGNADPQTQRRDLSSWSTGLELRREELVIGAAYVDNGDSNDATPMNEREWNAGVAWRAERWGAALSWARNESIPVDLSLVGVGGFYSINEHIVLRADAVLVDERPRVGPQARITVMLVELAWNCNGHPRAGINSIAHRCPG